MRELSFQVTCSAYLVAFPRQEAAQISVGNLIQVEQRVSRELLEKENKVSRCFKMLMYPTEQTHKISQRY